MRLGPPTIEGTLSVCSRAVRLRGQMRGATVEVVVDGQGAPIATGVADWGDEWFALPPTASFAVGDVVRARQILGADKSLYSSKGTKVVDRANPTPEFKAPLMACSTLAVIDRMTPGATVTVKSQSGAVLGTATPAGGRAEVTLSQIVGTSQKLRASTSACGGPASPTIESMAAQKMAPNGKLRTPQLIKPVYDCTRVLVFGNTLPGTELQLEWNGDVYFWPCTDIELHARIDPPLRTGDRFEFWIEPPSRACEAVASDRTKVQVPAGPPPMPVIHTTPCKGTTLIVIANLVETAVVTVYADDVEICVVQAGGGQQLVDLGTAALTPGQKITAAQAMCSQSSVRSMPVTVTKPPAAVNPKLPDPPMECGYVLRLIEVPPGAFVEVFSKLQGGRIGYETAATDIVDVIVSPAFAHGDEIHVEVSGCGGAALNALVMTREMLTPFIVEIPHEHDRSIGVTKAVAGAIFDVYLDGLWVSRTPAPAWDVRLPVPAPLKAGQTVEIVESLCGREEKSWPILVEAAKDVVFSRASHAGIDVGGGHFHSGRVVVAQPLGGGPILAGTEASGLWILTPGANALAVSGNWFEPRMLSLARGPRGPQHFYAGTINGMMESNTAMAAPLLVWHLVPGPGSFASGGPGAAVFDILILPGRNLVVIATNAGVWWSAIPPTPATGYTWNSAAAVNTGNFEALTVGPNESVIAYRNDGALGAAFFVGEWAGAALNWTNTTPGGPGTPDARLTTVAMQMGHGDLSSCPADRSRVWAALAWRSPAAWLAVLRSDDGGKTWQIPYVDPTLKYFWPPGVGGTIDMGYQADRNLTIGAHPLLRDTVILAGRRSGVLGSTTAGVTWDTTKWPAVLDSSFHADSICLTFDPGDPAGNTIIVGGDGGLFVSTNLGGTWNSSYNEHFPTLMCDQEGASSAPALSAAAGFPGLLVAALQDNGNVYLPATGEPWKQLFDGGDGQRALFVTGSVVLRGGNDNQDIKWSRWDGTKFTSPVVLDPPGSAPNTNFMPWVMRVPYPAYIDPADNALLRAVAGSNLVAGDVWGLFDRGATHTPQSERFGWRKLVTLPDQVYGVSSLNGKTIILGTSGPKIYRLDTATGTAAPMLLPAGLPAGIVRWPAMAGGLLAFALYNNTILRTTDLSTWVAVTPPPGPPEVIAVDRTKDPVALFAAGTFGAFYSRDLGNTWLLTKGLPSRPQANHLEVVDYGTGGRKLHMGTWNWSAWGAEI